MLTLFKSNEFVRFIVVGGIAALVNFVSRIAYSEVMTFRLAIIVAYITGMITAFILSKWVVFDASGKHIGKELYYFTLVNIAAVIQVWVISVGLAEYVFPRMKLIVFREEIAHLIGLGVPVITSYYGHKHISFGKDQNKA